MVLAKQRVVIKTKGGETMKICVVGLGYVGLPLALALAKKFDLTGFDINKERVNQLASGLDINNETLGQDLKKSKMKFASDEEEISKCDFIIVAVPTPINKAKKPDLTALESASALVGKNLKKGAIVVFESTVYPGVTEEVCVPIIEKYSKLKYKKDFKVGYSPERINPGDKEHSINKD